MAGGPGNEMRLECSSCLEGILSVRHCPAPRSHLAAQLAAVLAGVLRHRVQQAVGHRSVAALPHSAHGEAGRGGGQSGVAWHGGALQALLRRGQVGGPGRRGRGAQWVLTARLRVLAGGCRAWQRRWCAGCWPLANLLAARVASPGMPPAAQAARHRRTARPTGGAPCSSAAEARGRPGAAPVRRPAAGTAPRGPAAPRSAPGWRRACRHPPGPAAPAPAGPRRRPRWRSGCAPLAAPSPPRVAAAAAGQRRRQPPGRGGPPRRSP